MIGEFLALFSADAITGMVSGLVRFLVAIVAAYFASRIASKVIIGLRGRIIEAMERGAGGENEELEKRAGTIVFMIRKAIILAIWLVALIMALKELGFDVGPILAGAGVLGLAVGFGAQNLVRDVITGLFMLVENQIRVGDVAVINGQGGLVEEVNLRTTVLRSVDGTVHVFPNGSVSTLSNMTRGWSFYVFDLGVAYKEDVNRVMEAIRQVGAELEQAEPFNKDILAPVEIFGVDKFADSAVVIKGRIKTRPIQQWKIGREFNRRIKMRFDELGIEIPYPHLSVFFGDTSEPFQVESGQPNDNDQLKAVIREVLGEAGATS